MGDLSAALHAQKTAVHSACGMRTVTITLPPIHPASMPDHVLEPPDVLDDIRVRQCRSLGRPRDLPTLNHDYSGNPRRFSVGRAVGRAFGNVAIC
jgi:hypothetical protein